MAINLLRVAATGLLACTTTQRGQAELVGEWTFDLQTLANTGTAGASHDGTFMNSTGDDLYSVDTRSGTGFSLKVDSITDAPAGNLAGGEFLQINNTDSDEAGYLSTFDGSTFTTAMWIKTDGTWSQWDELASKGNEASSQQGENSGWAVRARLFGTHPQDGLRFNFYSDGSAARDDDPYDVDLLDSEWHLVTATYDGSEMNLYIDTFLVATAAEASLSGTDAFPLVYGARYNGARGEDLLIDSIQYYNTALSAQEVAELVSGSGDNGDFDTDGDVDGTDYLNWQRDGLPATQLADWQNTYGQTAAIGASAVPEPSTLAGVLVAIGCATAAKWSSRRP